MQVMTIDPVIRQFQIVHEAMYKAFASFDDIQICEAPNIKTEWTKTYIHWMDQFLRDEQKYVAQRVSSLSLALSKPEITQKVGGAPGEKNIYGIAVDNMVSTYGPEIIGAGSLTFDRARLLSLPPKTTLGILRREGPRCSATTSSGSPATGLPKLSSSPVCSTRQDKGGGICPQVILPTTTGQPCPPLTTDGQYCADLTTSAPPIPTPTICPDPNPNKNLAQNRCDEKCMGKGWGNCDPDKPGIANYYTCYCNDGPCGGQQCGDPVKIDNLTNKGQTCPVCLSLLFPPVIFRAAHCRPRPRPMPPEKNKKSTPLPLGLSPSLTSTSAKTSGSPPTRPATSPAHPATTAPTTLAS